MPLGRYWRSGTLGLVSWLALFGLALVKRRSHRSTHAQRCDVFGFRRMRRRGVDTAGIKKAAAYIAAEFAKAGLKPGGVNGTFFQPFTIGGTSKLEGKSTLTLKGPLGQEIELKLGNDFQVMGLSGPGKVTAPLVFVGYGATAPASTMTITRASMWPARSCWPSGRRRASARNWALTAPQRTSTPPWRKRRPGRKQQGRRVPACQRFDGSGPGDKLMPFKDVAGAAAAGIPALQLRRAIVDNILQSSLGTILLKSKKPSSAI